MWLESCVEFLVNLGVEVVVLLGMFKLVIVWLDMVFFGIVCLDLIFGVVFSLLYYWCKVCVICVVRVVVLL